MVSRAVDDDLIDEISILPQLLGDEDTPLSVDGKFLGVAEKEALIADLEAYKKSLIYETVTGKKEPEAAASGTGQEVA